jgi:hypothetical protein
MSSTYILIGYDVPPEIKVLSPVDQTYNGTRGPLDFAPDKTVSWMGYSLEGKENVAVTSNIALTGLSSG